MQRELTEQERAVHAVLETKLKMERVDGVVGASFTRRTERFAISNPVVFKVPGTDTVFVFSSIGYGYNIHALREHIERLRKIQEKYTSAPEPASSSGGAEPGDPVSLAEAVPSQDDVALLMSQAGVSQDKAEKALAENSYDVIKALSNLVK